MYTASATRDAYKLRAYLPELPEPVIKPVLIIISGLPGTGKSHFSRQLANKLPSLILESDYLRKKLFTSPTYTSSENQRLFSACHFLIEEFLKSGITVIFDATNLIEHNREVLYRIADRAQVKPIVVQVDAPRHIVQKRLSARTETPNPKENSDANWQTYEVMKQQAQKIRRNFFIVDTSKDISPVIAKIIKESKR